MQTQTYTRRSIRWSLLAAVTLTAAGSLYAAAQYSPAYGGNDSANGQTADPPNRVARVSYLQGNVSLEPAGVNDFSAAELNYPLTAGDRIYADNQAFSELQTQGLTVRLGNGADLTVSSLTDSVAQLGLAQGSIRVRTRDLQNDDGSQGVVEIDTPNGAILVQQPGDVRVDSYPQDDTTVVTVSSGVVEITAQGGSQGSDQQLGPGQSLRLSGSPAYAELLRVPRPDALDRLDQDRETERSRELAVSAQYVDPGMIGAGDLAQYGDWRPDPDYGGVWFPRNVDADWAPYRNGHWAWVAPWGWTWVEAEPWGFAPFHYGRWAQFGYGGSSRWGWVPGPPPQLFAGRDFGGRPPRPVYSPALVAFVGGPRLSISIGFGGGSGAGVTAWFPLGPRESYQPWYHASPGYVNRVNVTNLYSRNVTEVRNTYINRTTNVYNTNVTQGNYLNRPQATTAVAQRDFAAGRPAFGSNRLRLNDDAQRQLAQSPVLPHPLVTPASPIARPQQPPRVVPPLEARPVMATGRYTPGNQNQPQNQPQQDRGQGFGNRGGRQPQPQQPPANINPVNPVVAPVQRMPAPAQQPDQQQPNQRPQQQPGRQPAPPTPAPGAGGGGNGGQQNYPRGGFPQQREPRPEPIRASPITTQSGLQVNPPAQQQPAPVQGRPSTGQPMQMPQQPQQQQRGQQQQPVQQQRPMPRPAEQPRPLVNRTQPQPQQPSFAQQQQAIERHDPGRPLGPQQVENIRQGKPAGPAAQPEPVAHPPAATSPANNQQQPAGHNNLRQPRQPNPQ